MTRQQRWARDAFAKVCAQKGQQEAKYRTLCLKMPILIKQSGLVQALAFMRSRSDDAGRALCDDLAAVYFLPASAPGKEIPIDGERLLKMAQEENDLSAYMAISRDVIDVSVWFRRFAQSELKEGEAN